MEENTKFNLNVKIETYYKTNIYPKEYYNKKSW